jgi:hypothetical protein
MLPIQERYSVGSCPRCTSETVVRRFSASLDFGGAIVEGLVIKDCWGGISMENSTVRGRNWKFRNNRGSNITSINSDVEVDDVDIE